MGMENPLQIHPWLDGIVSAYLPFLVIGSIILNGIGLEALKSTFLQDLISVPILRALMILHLLLPTTGPVYVWLVQTHNLYLTTDQMYPCFMMLSIHNFLMVACAWVFALLAMERAITMSKSKAVWKMWQTVCGKVTLLAIGIAMMLSVGPLMVIRRPVTGNGDIVKAPVCLPWWGHGSDPVSGWFHFIAVVSMVGPCLTVVVAVSVLILFLARFCALVHWGSHGLDHYQAVNVGLKSVMHVKFVHAVLWLSFAFVITSGTLGLHILLAPNYEASEHHANDSSSQRNSLLCRQQVNLGRTSQNVPGDQTPRGNMTLASYDDRRVYPSNHCMTRADVECVLWLLYYSFSLIIVPILLASEVLFRREWKGTIWDFCISVGWLLGIRRSGRKSQGFNNRHVSCSDISFYFEDDVCHKLDPAKNANLQCFVNESTHPKNIKLRNTTMDGVTPTNATTDDDVTMPSSAVDPPNHGTNDVMLEN